MNDDLNIYELFARLLAYPESDCLDVAERCRVALAEVDESITEFITRFVDRMKDSRFEAIEELYTRTFDMGPARALEIGWHLYGENYDRGTFLVWMRQQLRDASLEESHELPDHIMHVLRILGRMEPADAAGFSTACVLPAMNTVHAAFKKDDDNPYENVVEAVCAFLTARHGPAAESDDVTSLPILQQHEELLAKESL